MNQFLESTSKPLTVGVVAGVTSGFMEGFGASAQIAGMQMNVPIAIGVIAGAASLAGVAAKNHVVPLVSGTPTGEMLIRAAAPVGTGAATAAGSFALVKLNGGQMTGQGIMTAFGVGAIAEIAGDYAHRSLVEPWAKSL